jgi:hypothetical protein
MGPIGAAFDQRRRRKNTIDALVDEYVRWREECVMVHHAYDFWTIAPPRERRLAHAAYLAALDREGEAAANYERRIHQAVPR